MAKRHLTIRMKLLIVLLLCSLLPTSIAGLVGYEILQSTISLLVSNHLRWRTEIIAERLRSWLSELEVSVSSVAGEIVSSQEEASGHTESTSQPGPQNMPLLELILKKFADQNDSIRTASLADLDDSTTFVSSEESSMNINFEGLLVFEEARLGKPGFSAAMRPRVRDALEDNQNEDSVIYFAHRINSSTISAILLLEIPTSSITRSVLPSDCPPGLSAYLLDKSGRILVTNEPHDSIWMETPEDKHRTYSLPEAQSALSGANKPPETVPFDGGISGPLNYESGFNTEGYRNHKGKLVIGAWKRLGQPARWSIIVEEDRSILMGPLDDLQLFLLVLLLALCALASLISFHISDRITRPLSNVLADIRSFSDGELSRRAEVRTSDEIGGLASTFNEMAHRLQRAISQLRRRNLQANRANEELQDFIHIVSHDLRAPLINIRGFSKQLAESAIEAVQLGEKLLQKTKDDDHSVETVDGYFRAIREKSEKSVGFITASINNIASMNDALLRIFRVDASRNHREITDLKGCIDKVIAGFEYVIAQKRIEVQVGPMPTVLCDPARISQVFFNLISNAINYIGDESRRQIEISSEELPHEHLFRISDTGIGIPKKDQQKVFRVFARLSKERCPGQGVGLTLTKKIIDRENGRIWLESEGGEGTRFFFTIPKTVPSPKNSVREIRGQSA